MQNSILKARKLLTNGELIVYPTDTLYGLGGNALDKEAIQRIYYVKKRPFSQPLSIIISSLDSIEKFAFTNRFSDILIDAFLPGALTLILKTKIEMPYISLNKKIAVRIPNHQVALSLARDFPVVSTSANIHGKSQPISVEQAKKQLGNNVSLYIDGGLLKGKPSTIVDVSDEKVSIIREGAIKKEEIYGYL